MFVRDAMSTAPVVVEAQSSLWGAIRLMLDRNVSGLPVVNEAGALVGVLSEGDLLRRVELGTRRPEGKWFHLLLHPGSSAENYKLAHGRHVADVMSDTPVTIAPAAPLEQAVALMERHGVKRLPVVEEGRLVGILSRSDFLRALAPRLAPRGEAPATSDTEIERRFAAELDHQGWAADTAIEIACKAGHVTLRGTIASEQQRDATRVLAENIDGVRSVTDQLFRLDPILQFAT